jgi:hypothetical protein
MPSKSALAFMSSVYGGHSNFKYSEMRLWLLWWRKVVSSMTFEPSERAITVEARLLNYLIDDK